MMPTNHSRTIGLLSLALFVINPIVMVSAQRLLDGNSSAIVGTVVDGDGLPVENKRVRAFQLTTMKGRPYLSESCSTITDRDGKYECAYLKPGRYILDTEDIEQTRKLENSTRTVKSAGFMFYSNTTDLALASTVTVQRNYVQDVNLVSKSIDAHSISLRLEPSLGHIQPSIYAMIDGLQKISVTLPMSYNPQSGEIEIHDVPPGLYYIEARSTDGERSRDGHVEVPVKIDDIDSLRLECERSARIQGQVELDAEHPSTVREIVLESQDGSMIDGQLAVAAIVDKGSRDFVFSSVPPGNYSLTVIDDMNSYIKSVRLGDMTWNGSRITVPSGSDTIQLRIALDASSATVRGIIHDRNDAGSRGSVVAQSEDSDKFYVASSDGFGNFTLVGLAPGAYRLYSWKDLDDIAFKDPATLNLYQDQSVLVSVTKGETVGGLAVPLMNAQ